MYLFAQVYQTVGTVGIILPAYVASSIAEIIPDEQVSLHFTTSVTLSS